MGNPLVMDNHLVKETFTCILTLLLVKDNHLVMYKPLHMVNSQQLTDNHLHMGNSQYMEDQFQKDIVPIALLAMGWIGTMQSHYHTLLRAMIQLNVISALRKLE